VSPTEPPGYSTLTNFIHTTVRKLLALSLIAPPPCSSSLAKERLQLRSYVALFVSLVGSKARSYPLVLHSNTLRTYCNEAERYGSSESQFQDQISLTLS
jgi:hypothetical protein